MTVVIAIVFTLTLTAILLGSKIAQTRLPLKSYVVYFTLFGLLAPLWLARSVWGAALARESVGR